MLHFRLFLLSIFLLPFVAFGQKVTVSGTVKDEKTKLPLAFVHILSESGRGTISDIDGKFSLGLKKKECCLKLTSIGYETLNYDIDYSSERQTVYLEPTNYDLGEVVVFPGINPAHRIIDSVVANRDRNNPQKLKAFSYTSYDKMTVRVDSDSLMAMDTTQMDSTAIRMRQFMKTQDIFIMETVTERKFKAPSLNQETVLATRISGFKDPMMAFMISQIQSTSFYDEQINIAGKKYVNPISRGSTRKYFFMIEDTTYTHDGDTIFTISFRPMKNTNFEGMKGVLNIHTNRWAINSVKAQPTNDTTGIVVKIEQLYEFVQDQWFPSQLRTNVTFMNAQMGPGGNSFQLVGNGSSYIKNLNLDPELKSKDFGYNEVEIEPDAAQKKGEFWKEYRVDSLTERELKTYRVIDSIGEEANFDRLANTVQTLFTGKIPIKFIDLDVNKFAHYNGFEGFYIGAGAHTNDKVSKVFSVGGYWGYGFGDKRAKYGGDFSVLLHKRSQSRIRLDAYYNVIASGDVEFFDDKDQLWKPEYFYKFFVSQMNYTIGGDLNYSFKIRPLRSFKWNVGLRMQQKQAYQNYYFTPNGDTSDKQTVFDFTDVSIGFRFAFRERTIETTKGEFSFGSDYPVVHFKYTRGVTGMGFGNYNYNRFDLKIDDKINFKYFGEFTYRLMGGIVLGQVPISNTFNGNGTYRMFTVYAPYSFGTMRTNEFYSNRYAAVFLSHNFKNLLFDFKKWHPELVLLTNVAIGTMTDKQDHHNLDFNTLEMGYYESGLGIRKLLDLQVYDLGAVVMYRYGPYGFENVSLNFAYKISLFYNF